MGDSLEDQVRQIELFAERLSTGKKKVVIVKWIELRESASVAFDHQPILKAIEYIRTSKKKITYVLFKSIDRSTRGGIPVYDYIKKEFAKCGVQMLDAHGVISTQTINTLAHLNVEYPWSMTNTSEISEYMMAMQAQVERKQILSRLIGAEIGYVQQGYRVRQAPPGYINTKIDTPQGKRTVLALHPKESILFIRMFELRAVNTMTDQQIVDEINTLGYSSRTRKKYDSKGNKRVIGYTGGIKLKVKQMLRYIQNPIYAGFNTEKWTNGKAIKCHFEGLVSIDTWNKANRGKITIVDQEDCAIIEKGQPKEWQVRKNKDNPMYPYKRYVLCPFCRKHLLGSASRGKSGKYFPAYHCSRGHKSYRIPVAKLEETIKKFVSNIKFSEAYKKRFREIVLEEWERRERTVSTDTAMIHGNLKDYELEMQLLKDKIKQVNLPSLIASFEKDIEKLEQEKLNANVTLSHKQEEQTDIQTEINFTQYYMEHLDDLLLGSDNPQQNAAMFGLLFAETPTYVELTNGTPRLAPIFELNRAFEESEEQCVSHRGLEPRTTSLRARCSTS